MQLDLKIVKHLDIFTIIFPIFKICIKWKFNKIDRRERNEKEINIFTGYDIKKLWDNIKIDWVEYILIMIYTGMRIGEAVNLKKENVDLINGIIFGGNKTEKGMNRKIPIRDDIYPIIQNLYKNSPTDYLFYNKNWVFKKKNNENKPLKTKYFRERFNETIETLGIEKHQTHDCRKTLATFMRKYQLNEVQITDILGHESINTTIDYYIKKEDEQELKKSINRIDFFKDVV
ncbi:tyrosine-type recombinase/integrase [Leptotrichia shahii]|uniref:tyrosine-type recombinase/integrase n=1 Tax=Leptotrichia shahii TaxID=157691 RepID=UPI0028D2B963|nr:tyrosine-type recombinase/integrase [Leptotrichia shahii]